MTDTVTIQSNPTAAQQRALEVLAAGGVLAFPTDTVYGVGGDATNPSVAQRVAALKERPEGKPFPMLVADMEMAKEYGIFSPEAETVAKERWPGATTLLVPDREGNGKVGLRVPDHAWVRGLIAAFGKPVIGTSANTSGKPPATKAQDVRLAVDIVLDGGTCSGAPSEVLDVTSGTVTVVRER
jgi:L-threonylcarbamoyladenylate synthase